MTPVYHISAPPGTGKTTLMYRVRRRYGHRLTTRDTDLLDDHRLFQARRRAGRGVLDAYRDVGRGLSDARRAAARKGRPLALFGVGGHAPGITHRIRLKVGPLRTLWRRTRRGLRMGGSKRALLHPRALLGQYGDIRNEIRELDALGYKPMRAKKILKLLGAAA